MQLLLWISLFVMVTAIDRTHVHRAKRLVAFRKGSTFFYRLNYKINSVAWTTIIAHASGFKVAWHLPDGSRARRAIEDLHESTQLLYESHGFNGAACLAKNICEAMSYASRKDGVMAKILKLLARASNANWTHAEDMLIDCDHHALACPLQLININSFSEP